MCTIMVRESENISRVEVLLFLKPMYYRIFSVLAEFLLLFSQLIVEPLCRLRINIYSW